MAVTIISNEEKYSKVIDGAKFHYRRLPGKKRASIVRRFTDKKTGFTDWQEATQVMLEYCIIGWENVVTNSGEIVPYSLDLVQFIPDEVQAILVDLVGANIDTTVDEVKNLSNTQNNNSEITD